MKNSFTKNILVDGKGVPSSKRVVTFVASLLLFVVVVANTFFNAEIDQFVFEGLMYVVIAGLGTTAAENFAFKNKDVQTTDTKKEEMP